MAITKAGKFLRDLREDELGMGMGDVSDPQLKELLTSIDRSIWEIVDLVISGEYGMAADRAQEIQSSAGGLVGILQRGR